MIKVLILYYLSLKSTHGYEIQKFIQTNRMVSWSKIQSGSIYHALSKLEKEGLIQLSGTQGKGAKARKVYCITSQGKEELKRMVREELSSSMYEVGSDKFILYPLLCATSKQEIKDAVSSHIKDLKRKKDLIERWKQIKVTDRTLEVEKISFEMMLSSLYYQIQWHQALIRQLDRCMEESKAVSELIRSFDFSVSTEKDLEQVTNLESLQQFATKQ